MDKLSEFDIGVLRLEPGDVLVLKTSKPLCEAACVRVRESLKPVLPLGARVIVLEPPIESCQVVRGPLDPADVARVPAESVA